MKKSSINVIKKILNAAFLMNYMAHDMPAVIIFQLDGTPDRVLLLDEPDLPLVDRYLDQVTAGFYHQMCRRRGYPSTRISRYFTFYYTTICITGHCLPPML